MMALRFTGPPSPRVLAQLLVVGLASGCASNSATPPTPASSGDAPSSPAAIPAETPWVCPDGPFERPIAGERTAEAIPGTEPTALAPGDTEFHLYEGALWWGGALHFSDFRTTAGFPARILRHRPGQGLEVVVADSGSNGLALDPSGTKLAAARHASKSVAVFSAEQGTWTDVAGLYEGRRFNSPNDLVFRADGNLYFTDPNFQAGGDEPQPTTNVYRVAPDGTVAIVDDTMRNPNGIALSPDGATLYVAGNLEQGLLKAYPVAPDGAVGTPRVLRDGLTVPDGMAIDCAGNIYVTEHSARRILVLAPDGEELGRIVGMDKNVTNAAFGGPDRKTLFITGTGGLFRIDVPVPGLPY